MCFLKFMADWGIWDIIGLLGALIPTAILFAYLFPRRATKNLYIDTKRGSVNQTYPKVIVIEFHNHTNEPLYIISDGFTFGTSLKPSPYGAKDAATGVYEVKFEGRQNGILSEIDTIIRPNQIISTWIPLDPSQLDSVIDTVLGEKRIGSLRLRCQFISERRNLLVRLNIPV